MNIVAIRPDNSPYGSPLEHKEENGSNLIGFCGCAHCNPFFKALGSQDLESRAIKMPLSVIQEETKDMQKLQTH